MALTGTIPFKLYRPIAFGASGDGVAVTTLAGNLTLTFGDEQHQALNPNGTNRNITLPAADPEHKGCFFTVYNNGTVDAALTVKDGATTLTKVGMGGTATVVCTSSAWKVVADVKVAQRIVDPGTGVAIPVTASGSMAITQNGAETNTLANPTFMGQTISLFVDTDTSGQRVVTAAARVNQPGNTVMTFTSVGAFIKLEAITIAGALRWQVVAFEGVTLA